MVLKDKTEQKVRQGIEENRQIDISDFVVLKVYDKQIKKYDEQIKELEEKKEALREIKAKREIEEKQLDKEFKQLPPTLALGFKEILELDKQIKDLIDQKTEKSEVWKEEALRSNIKEEVADALLAKLGFVVTKEGEDRKRKSRSRDVKYNIVGVLDMDTLVNSSPKTRNWLDRIKTKIEGDISSLTYEEKEYWAVFKSRVTNRDVCQLNPQKNQIRLLTTLPLYLDYELEPTSATGDWEKSYPSLFVIKSDKDMEKAIDLIILSWIRD